MVLSTRMLKSNVLFVMVMMKIKKYRNIYSYIAENSMPKQLYFVRSDPANC